MLENKKNVLFDMDGLLIDSEALGIKMWEKVFAQHNEPFNPEAAGSLTVVSIFSLTKSLKTLIISMLLSFFVVKFVKFNVGICRIVWYNSCRRRCP